MIMNWLNDLGIGRKLAVGFGLISAVLIGIVVMVTNGIHSNSTITSRVIELRQPTVLASTELLNGVNQSLAGLRGYMILGKDHFKDERADGWKQINAAVATMNELSKSWTNPENVERLTRVNSSLKIFAQAQQEIEDISASPENNPATRMLVLKAAPRADQMIEQITAMIDIEATLPATPERKALLGMMADVRGTTGMAVANIRAFLSTGDPAFRVTFDRFWTKNTLRYGDLSNNQHLFNDAQVTAFAAFGQARDTFKDLPKQMFEIRATNSWDLANLWLGTKAAPEAMKIKRWMTEMVADQQGLAQIDTVAAIKSSNNLSTFTYVLGALALAIAGFIAWGTTRMITSPIQMLTESIGEISRGHGDLSRRLKKTSDDELGQLTDHFNNMLETLHGIMFEIRHMSTDLTHSIGDISVQNSQISTGANSQSNQALKIAAAMEEMNATVTEVSKNSGIAADSAREAMAIATKGGEVVQQTITGMHSLSDRVSQSTSTIHALGANTDKIGQIVLVIDEIADQTNLLALNAAIEAARAGDQGRGFSVVADEVRKLAERTTQATKEIGTMISAIQKETNNVVEVMNASLSEAERETELVNESGEALSNIIEVIGSVTDMVEQIAIAAREQAIATDEITTNIEGIASVTEETASSIQRSVSVSNELVSNAKALENTIGAFTLRDTK
jgi:methyl-accepting chemotaxis protein